MGTREYNGVLRQKCKAFAIRIVKLYQYVSTEKKETVMSKQLLRAGPLWVPCSVKANVRKVNLILFINMQ